MPRFSPEMIRSIALVGHGAAGKTTLAEALLHRAGVIAATGSVEKGSTVCDFDPLEKSYQHSLNSAAVHLNVGDTRIHLIDTPGLPDFVGRAIGALPAVETAAVVINAQNGIEMITTRMMQWAAKRNLCVHATADEAKRAGHQSNNLAPPRYCRRLVGGASPSFLCRQDAGSTLRFMESPESLPARIGTMNRDWKVAQTAQSAVSQVANQLCSAEDLL